jgi:hypothetical protein
VDFADDQYPMTHPVIQSGEPARFERFYDRDAGTFSGSASPNAAGDRFDHQVYEGIEGTCKRVRTCSFSTRYLPDGMGLAVSEDVLAMISPKLYEEFSLPYINQLSEEFGGVIVHSCGNFEHQLNVLSKVHKLRGINFGVNEMSFESLYSKFGGKTVLIPHLSSASIIADYQTAYEWVEHFASLKLPAKGIALMLAPDIENIHATDMKMALGEQSSNTSNLMKILMFGNKIRKILKKTYR